VDRRVWRDGSVRPRRAPGGGYITAGYAAQHPEQVAGMVFVDVGAPLLNPPSEIIDETRPDNPENTEKRDYLQVEKDAWAARRLIGDIPVTVISNQYSEDEIAGAEFPSERRGMATNVEEQRGWLVLSPRAEPLVVTTGQCRRGGGPPTRDRRDPGRGVRRPRAALTSRGESATRRIDRRSVRYAGAITVRT